MPLPSHCPDCREPLQHVKLLDATQPGWNAAGAQHVELGYAAEDAKPSFFLRAIPRLGVVRGLICPGCGRILLYGQPAE